MSGVDFNSAYSQVKLGLGFVVALGTLVQHRLLNPATLCISTGHGVPEGFSPSSSSILNPVCLCYRGGLSLPLLIIPHEACDGTGMTGATLQYSWFSQNCTQTLYA